jgi:2'-5' RNA ligase
VRWTSSASWHLTLLFLGSVVQPSVPDAVRLVDEVAAMGGGPYRVRASEGGGRSRRDDGTAWLGLSVGAGRLIALADALAERCPPDITTGATPRRTPSAHLTVARRVDSGLIETLRTQTLGQLDVSWQVDRLALVRSHLEPAGARYETVHESPL